MAATTPRAPRTHFPKPAPAPTPTLPARTLNASPATRHARRPKTKPAHATPASARARPNEHPQTGRHFACAVYVVHDGRVCLVQHPTLKSLLPPGGYVEPGETPQDAAARELREETGLDIELVPPRALQDDGPAATALAPPWFMQLERLRDGHEHIDLVFAARVKRQHANDHADAHEWKWYSASELRALPDRAIYADSREMALAVLDALGAKGNGSRNGAGNTGETKAATKAGKQP